MRDRIEQCGETDPDSPILEHSLLSKKIRKNRFASSIAIAHLSIVKKFSVQMCSRTEARDHHHAVQSAIPIRKHRFWLPKGISSIRSRFRQTAPTISAPRGSDLRRWLSLTHKWRAGAKLMQRSRPGCANLASPMSAHFS